MAFSEPLAQRIRQRLARRKNVEEKKMFGGVGFLLNFDRTARLPWDRDRRGLHIHRSGRRLHVHGGRCGPNVDRCRCIARVNWHWCGSHVDRGRKHVDGPRRWDKDWQADPKADSHSGLGVSRRQR
jgi:hypothetical protein